MIHQQLRSVPGRFSFSIFKAAKLLAGLGILISITSRGNLDPTLFNLLTPAEGVQNWLGLPGALLSGVLIDGLGKMSLLLPLYLLFVRNVSEAGVFQILRRNIVTALLITSLVSSLMTDTDTQIVQITGLWGLATNQAIVTVFGQIPSFCLIVGLIVVHNYGFWGSYHLDGYLLVTLGGVLSLLLMLTQSVVSQFSVLNRMARSAAKRFKQSVWVKAARYSTSIVKHTVTRIASCWKRQWMDKTRLFASRKASQKRKDMSNTLEKVKKSSQSTISAEEYVYASEYRNRLHQALKEFKRTNFPGNDIEIEILEKL